MTLLEYLDTPESAQPEELIFGTYRAAESPTPRHQATVASLFLALHEHVRRHAFGAVWFAPLDVILDRDAPLVVQPDLFVIRNGGAAIVSDKVRGAPDLVVEVLSPFPRIGEAEERVGWFRDYGVRECWLVHQIQRTVDVRQFAPGAIARQVFARDERIESIVLPDFDRTLDSILGY